MQWPTKICLTGLQELTQKFFKINLWFLLSTSPGGRGGATVLAQAVNSTPHFAGEVKASLSVPSFNDNFDVEKGMVINEEISAELVKAVSSLSS